MVSGVRNLDPFRVRRIIKESLRIRRRVSAVASGPQNERRLRDLRDVRRDSVVILIGGAKTRAGTMIVRGVKRLRDLAKPLGPILCAIDDVRMRPPSNPALHRRPKELADVR